MNKKILKIAIVSFLAFPIIAFGQQTLSELVSRANKEIDTRIENLNRAITRVGGMRRVTDANRDSIVAPLKTQISDLSALRTKINSDSDVQTALSDLKSITSSYRVYALVLPRAAIYAAGERVNYTASMLKDVKAKIKARLDKLTPGTDILAITQLLSDFDVKISSAESKVESAKNEIANLQPDNGDPTKMQSNLNALKDARDRIRSAHQDIKDARRDLGEAIRLIRELEKK